MPTLLLANTTLLSTKPLAEAAQNAGWPVLLVDNHDKKIPFGKLAFYGGTDQALPIANQFDLALLEPPLDLLARMPRQFLLRTVEYAQFRDLVRLKSATFVKPADALNKSFDAGVYANVHDIRVTKPIPPETPVLLSEQVDWSTEYRCFIREGKIAAWSPYISFGRPVWKQYAKGTLANEIPAILLAFGNRLFAQVRDLFPPAFAMDVGYIEDHGWAVVEFNPVWCSGLLGANPSSVLGSLDRATQSKSQISESDSRWNLKR